MSITGVNLIYDDMYHWVIYDIRANRSRSKISKLCKQIGLHRVQKSVFLGEVRETLLKKFQEEVKNIVNYRTDVVFIVPMNNGSLTRVVQIGNGFDKNRLSRSNPVIFI